LIGIGAIYHQGALYYWSILIASALFVYQQHLIRDRKREQCFQAFLNNNYVGMIITLGIFSSYL
ncbi:4-hydroxybenzoate octaprenyltransferase, partial [Vibrio sp.]|nr:4-hydroxybenzoate octaprenyltransferase [Vibrio sp.]